MLHANIRLAGIQVVPIGYGLEKKSAEKYVKEWKMYLKFMASIGVKIIPGRDKPWSIRAAKAYLEWRAQTNNVRSLAQIKSRLKHCGLCYNHLLPTAKGEGPSRLKLQLSMVSKEVGKKWKKKLALEGKSTAPKRSLALGNVAIGLLFSAYNAGTKRGFAKLSRDDVRHHLVTCISMHTGCMRFGLIQEMREKEASFRWSEPDQCWRLASDWHKMKRRVDTYMINYPKKPAFKAMKYHVYANNGSARREFTAAKVIQWQMELEGSRKAVDLFAPENSSSAEFRRWLRASFKALLAEDAEEVKAMVDAITPHSFRAGMAGDLERENVPRPRIKKAGRWDSDRAMEQYIRDGLAQRLRKIDFYRINCAQKRIKDKRGKLQIVKMKMTDSSEGYDSSVEERDE